MSQSQLWIEGLSDGELVFLYAYKGKTYLPEQKSRLEGELLRRNLNESAKSAILREVQFNSNNTGCDRCNSMKALVEGECPVCSWNPAEQQRRKRKWLDPILDILVHLGHALGGGH